MTIHIHKVLFFSWFCHFDDDQYVNVAALESKLRQFDERKDWYLGKPSIGKPLDILDRDDPDTQVIVLSLSQKVTFSSLSEHSHWIDICDKLRRVLSKALSALCRTTPDYP